MAIKAKIEVDNKELKKGLKDAEKQATSSMSKIAEATNSVNSGLKGMLGFLGKIGPYAAAAVAAVGLVITGIVAAIKAIHNLALNLNQIGKEAAAVNMTTDSFQALQYAAKIAGLEIQQVQKIVTKVQYALYQAEKGSKNAADAFADLGISWEELAKLSPDVQLMVILRALEKIGDLSKRNKAIFQLFDKRDIQIMNKLIKADFSREVANAKNMGVIINADAIKNAELYNDSIGTANQRLTAMVANWKTTKETMKGLAEMANEFTESLNNSDGRVDKNYSSLYQGIGDAADELEAKLKANDKAEWARLQKLIKERAEMIKSSRETAVAASKGNVKADLDEASILRQATRDIMFREVAIRDTRFDPNNKKTWVQRRVPEGYMKAFDVEYIKAGQIKNRLVELQEMLAKKKQKHDEELASYDKEIDAQKQILQLENELGIKADENQKREVINAAVKANTVQNQVAIKMLEEEIKLMEMEAEVQVAVINGDTKRAEILRSIIKLRNKGFIISEEDIKNNQANLEQNKKNLEVLKAKQATFKSAYEESSRAEQEIQDIDIRILETEKKIAGAREKFKNAKNNEDKKVFADAVLNETENLNNLKREKQARQEKIDSLKNETQAYKDLGDQIDKTNEKISKNEAVEAANQTGKAAEDAQKKVDDANIKRKSEQLELENKIAQAELDGDLERADNLRLINELKQMGINITEEELEKDKERYKELVKQRDLQKQLNLEKSFKDKGNSLLTQAMKQTGFAKEAAYLEAIRNAEKTKGAKLTDEEIEKVKRMTDLQFRLNDLGNFKLDDMGMKTNELTARGGFASGAVFTDKDTLNEQLRNYAEQQTKLLSDIKQEIKNGGLT